MGCPTLLTLFLDPDGHAELIKARAEAEQLRMQLQMLQASSGSPDGACCLHAC